MCESRTDLEALASISQIVLRHRNQWAMEHTNVGDIVNAVWDVVEHFDIGGVFRVQI